VEPACYSCTYPCAFRFQITRANVKLFPFLKEPSTSKQSDLLDPEFVAHNWQWLTTTLAGLGAAVGGWLALFR
jgi:hypothetical protein